MTSQVLNLLWLNLELPPPHDPDDGTIRTPLPRKYIKNVRKAGKRHPQADIHLWVDSQRLTKKQMNYLKDTIEQGLPNVHLKDLRDIQAYRDEKLYNSGETSPIWREDQSSLIWRQVDCAKILISLQGDYDQKFFADMDRAHIDITSQPVQDMLDKNGLLIGSGCSIGTSIENQLWGFKRERRGFFEQYYLGALRDAYKIKNAFGTLIIHAGLELGVREDKKVADYCLPIGADGTQANHPGYKYSGINTRHDSLAEQWEKAKKHLIRFPILKTILPAPSGYIKVKK